MLKKNGVSVTALLAFFIIFNAYGADGYKCHIKMANGLTNEGKMVETDYSRLYKNGEFVVDRGTGRTTGRIINHNAYGQPSVLDFGSKSQAYKVVTIYKPMTAIAYLYIQEFSDTQDKTFLLL